MKENLHVCHKTHAEGSTKNYNGVRDGYEEKDLVSYGWWCGPCSEKKPKQQAACEIRNGWMPKLKTKKKKRLNKVQVLLFWFFFFWGLLYHFCANMKTETKVIKTTIGVQGILKTKDCTHYKTVPFWFLYWCGILVQKRERKPWVRKKEKKIRKSEQRKDENQSWEAPTGKKEEVAHKNSFNCFNALLRIMNSQ